MADTNKVKFGLKNVYFSKITVTGGVYSYATPKAILGAVNLSLDASGDETTFFADDTKYYNVTNDTGYNGTLEVAKIAEDFFTDIFGFVADSNGVIFEDAEVEPAQFALLFEFSGDKNNTRHVLYNCTCSRPSMSSQTTTESKEPVTETMNITCSPLPIDANGRRIVKAKEVEGGSEYSGWFNNVYVFSA